MRLVFSLPLPELQYLVRTSAARHTSVSPGQWSSDNPLYGHCAVTTVLVQDFFDGVIQRGELPKDWQERLGFRSHYWNILPGGARVDLTRDQFPPDFPYEDFISGRLGDTRDDIDKREHILRNLETRSRYGILRDRVMQLLYANPLFYDGRFQRCWELAFSEEAKCAKMRFACIVFDGDRIVAEGVNKFFTEEFGRERFCAFDGSRCIRVDLGSRTDATLGDCGHAPIWCVRLLWERGYPLAYLPLLNFYEAGFFPDGAPWWRTAPDYTCLHCQNIFAIFGLDRIKVPYDGAWTTCFTKDSLYSSVSYATGGKEV